MRMTSRKWLGLLAVGAAGMLFQSSGCAQYSAEFLIQTFDFCSVLNCAGGTFFNFCDPIVLFTDCL